MVQFFLELVSYRGRRIVGQDLGASRASGRFFRNFEEKITKTQKTGLHADLYFTFD